MRVSDIVSIIEAIASLSIAVVTVLAFFKTRNIYKNGKDNKK